LPIGIHVATNDYFLGHQWKLAESVMAVTSSLYSMVERCGPERFLWASDFPHFEASPEPVKETKEAVVSLPASLQQKILGDNAAEAYQLS